MEADSGQAHTAGVLKLSKIITTLYSNDGYIYMAQYEIIVLEGLMHHLT